MALRALGNVGYLPILSLRPAEMKALEELPASTKSAMLPVVHMRPWVNSLTLDRSIARVEAAYGDRPIVVSIADATDTIGRAREVHRELDALRRSARGYRNWCEFVEDHDNYIPAVQLGEEDHVDEQIRFFHALGRGIFVLIERDGFGALTLLARRVAALTDGGRDVCFILDYGVANADHQLIAAQVVQQHAAVLRACPRAYVSVSASSFPVSFRDLPAQAIYERLLFDEVAGQIGLDRLIYSDRGSARVERPQGGGGIIPPRIDYPLDQQWRFYRSDESNGNAGFPRLADAIVRSAAWDPNLRVWGTLMIERTRARDDGAITSLQRATAVRINLHLQRQTFYGDNEQLYETEDDWDL